jgi:hypothetical protein
VGKRFCDVTVQIPDGKRHTITVQESHQQNCLVLAGEQYSTG